MNFQVDEQFSVLIISVNYGNPSPVEDLIKSINKLLYNDRNNAGSCKYK